MNSPFRINGTIIVSDGTIWFNDDVTKNTLQISGIAVVHLPNKVKQFFNESLKLFLFYVKFLKITKKFISNTFQINFFKNLEISGTPDDSSLVTYTGSTVIIDTSMILTGDIGGR